jgi:hypothetical protein
MSSYPGWGSWSLNPVVILALLAAAVAYTRVYRRAAARSSRSTPNASHWLPYAGGLLALAVALLSPLDPIGDKYLLSAHMMQHVLLSDIAPALLVLGLRSPILPLGLSRRALLAVAPGGRSGRLLARLTSPWLAIPLWALATWVWAIPSVFVSRSRCCCRSWPSTCSRSRVRCIMPPHWLARRAEVEALQPRGDDRRRVGQRGGRARLPPLPPCLRCAR